MESLSIKLHIVKKNTGIMGTKITYNISYIPERLSYSLCKVNVNFSMLVLSIAKKTEAST
jgi:hypothetical protein